MSDHTNTQLKPCPFCGGTKICPLEGSTFRWVVAECAECGARCGEVHAYDDYTFSNTALVTAWNSRAAPQDEMVAFLLKVAALPCARVDGDTCAFFERDVSSYCAACHAEELLEHGKSRPVAAPQGDASRNPHTELQNTAINCITGPLGARVEILCRDFQHAQRLQQALGIYRASPSLKVEEVAAGEQPPSCAFCDSGLVFNEKEIAALSDLYERTGLRTAKILKHALALYQSHIVQGWEIPLESKLPPAATPVTPSGAARKDNDQKWRVALRMFEKTQAALHTLRQQIEDTILVAQTDTDEEDTITAYHFKTGAIHRLLAKAREGDGPANDGDNAALRSAIADERTKAIDAAATEIAMRYFGDYPERAEPTLVAIITKNLSAIR